ncbi:MAG: helix-turn-helix transcriptional regulator [Pseudohongiellaceae bacterium]
MGNNRIESMRLELRRGVLVLVVLNVLRDEHYGYSLRKRLQERGLKIEEGTLYPLIRRLEDLGLLHSRWSNEEGRRRRYYRISADGQMVRDMLTTEWQGLNRVVETVQEAAP